MSRYRVSTEVEKESHNYNEKYDDDRISTFQDEI